MSTFQELRIVDNFYQTSLFYPMPAVLVSTLTDDGKTTCGPYSLLAPFYVAGKPFYAFMLECRNSSNTAQNLIKHKKCVINFLPDDRKTFKEMVRLGWPGDTPAEKMKNFRFHRHHRGGPGRGMHLGGHPGQRPGRPAHPRGHGPL